MAFVLVLVVAATIIVLLMRAGAAKWGPDSGGGTAPRPQRRPRPSAQAPGALGPDDDPDFLRELERRTRRDDGSPA